VRLVHERVARPFVRTRSLTFAAPSPPSPVSLPLTKKVETLLVPTSGRRVISPRSVKVPSLASLVSPLIVPRPQRA
jgi:hypothetical protein